MICVHTEDIFPSDVINVSSAIHAPGGGYFCATACVLSPRESVMCAQTKYALDALIVPHHLHTPIPVRFPFVGPIYPFPRPVVPPRACNGAAASPVPLVRGKTCTSMCGLFCYIPTYAYTSFPLGVFPCPFSASPSPVRFSASHFRVSFSTARPRIRPILPPSRFPVAFPRPNKLHGQGHPIPRSPRNAGWRRFLPPRGCHRLPLPPAR